MRRFEPSRPQTPEERRRAFYSQVRQKAALRMSKALRTSRADAIAAVAELSNVVDQNSLMMVVKADEARSRGVMIAGIACKEGCAHCCHFRIAVSVPELLRIADYIRRALSPDEIEALCAAARTYVETLSPLAPYQRSTRVLACPMLKDGNRCSIYSVRPISCRLHHSLDLQSCLKAMDDLGTGQVPQILEIAQLARPILDGMEQGTRAADLHPRQVDLVRGLLLALKSDAEAQWMAGQDSFAEAEDGELLRLAMKR